MSQEQLDDVLRQPFTRHDNDEFLRRVMVQIPVRRERSRAALSAGLLFTCGATAYFVPARLFETALNNVVHFMNQPMNGILVLAAIVFSWMVADSIRK